MAWVTKKKEVGRRKRSQILVVHDAIGGDGHEGLSLERCREREKGGGEEKEERVWEIKISDNGNDD